MWTGPILSDFNKAAPPNRRPVCFFRGWGPASLMPNVESERGVGSMKKAQFLNAGWLALSVLVMNMTGCGHYPANVSSRRDIQRADPREMHIVVTGLPEKDCA